MKYKGVPIKETQQGALLAHLAGAWRPARFESGRLIVDQTLLSRVRGWWAMEKARQNSDINWLQEGTYGD